MATGGNDRHVAKCHGHTATFTQHINKEKPNITSVLRRVLENLSIKLAVSLYTVYI